MFLAINDRGICCGTCQHLLVTSQSGRRTAYWPERRADWRREERAAANIVDEEQDEFFLKPFTDQIFLGARFGISRAFPFVSTAFTRFPIRYENRSGVIKTTPYLYTTRRIY